MLIDKLYILILVCVLVLKRFFTVGYLAPQEKSNVINFIFTQVLDDSFFLDMKMMQDVYGDYKIEQTKYTLE